MKECSSPLLNHPIDISRDFAALENPVFLGDRLGEFDTERASGEIIWKRHAHHVRMAFNQDGINFAESDPWEFPPEYFGKEEALPFSLSFIGTRTVRLRISAQHEPWVKQASPMLAREPRAGKPWAMRKASKSVTYRSSGGAVVVHRDPWRLEFLDATGRSLTQTQHHRDTRCLRNTDPVPFCFVRKAPEHSRRFAASFALAPNERIFGCGESFTRLDKRGQKVVLYSYDGHGVLTDAMYKPVPFFLSNRGYGMFLHTTTPATFDFGHSYDAATTLFCGDAALDLFVFLGDPKSVVSQYTALTGRSPTPPLWSFGLWMSRCTYSSEKEVRSVAGKLRKRRIPSDVVHIDTGWFEDDWRCDYRFSRKRFDDPKRMIGDLGKQGFRISLWQLPYFTPRNRIFPEIIKKGYAVRDGRGGLPSEDAVLDFTNPEAVTWYKKQLASLLKMGVGAIKVDFGEAAPVHGIYASGRTGFAEHNAYPLLYNRAVAEVTNEVTGEHIIWARSAWAGSQRYPIHWGGDAEDSYNGMAATLRGGLSLGLSGFSFWSHDIGGFVHPAPEELYRRWTPFGMLTSHSRCHGVPPREPWAYGKRFEDEFRQSVELKYRLMPYVWAQALASSEAGFPMLRTLFFEYPEDPTSWFIEDEYLFGSELLVAPLFEQALERLVYLPPGSWVDYQSGEAYEGARWHRIAAGGIPIVLLVRDGAVLPHARLAQSTGAIDWSALELVSYASVAQRATGLVATPEDRRLREVSVVRGASGLELQGELPPGVRVELSSGLREG